MTAREARTTGTDAAGPGAAEATVPDARGSVAVIVVRVVGTRAAPGAVEHRVAVVPVAVVPVAVVPVAVAPEVRAREVVTPGTLEALMVEIGVPADVIHATRPAGTRVRAVGTVGTGSPVMGTSATGAVVAVATIREGGSVVSKAVVPMTDATNAGVEMEVARCGPAMTVRSGMIVGVASSGEMVRAGPSGPAMSIAGATTAEPAARVVQFGPVMTDRVTDRVMTDGGVRTARIAASDSTTPVQTLNVSTGYAPSGAPMAAPTPICQPISICGCYRAAYAPN